MSSLHGQRILIIGGSSGIGLRVAELAAGQGAALLIAGRHAGRLAEASGRLQQLAPGVAVDTLQVDAHDHDALARAWATLAPVDHVVSMVGDVGSGGFLSVDLAEIRRVMESKFFTNVRIAQLAAPRLRDGGSLVFTAGTGGRAQHACGPYVGNLGIQALVQGVAAELAPRARANAVAPTWTLTPFWRDQPAAALQATQAHFEQAIPLRRLAQIDELAQAYLFLMTNGFITGQTIAVDGGVMLGA